MTALFSLYAVIFSATLTLRSERSSRLEGREPDGYLYRSPRPRRSFETQAALAPQDEGGNIGGV